MSITLRDFQIEGVKKISENEKKYGIGSVLAFDMGLGKTLTFTQFLLEKRKLENPVNSDLLIVPLCVLTQWKSEIHKLDEKADVFIYHGLSRVKELNNLLKVPDFVIGTYHCLVTRELEHKNWNRIVLDEAHIIRNGIDTGNKTIPKRVLGAFSISKKANFCHCISGTPFNNGKSDIKSLMKFVGYRGVSDKDVENFVSNFVLQKTKEDIMEPIEMDTIFIERPEKGLEAYNQMVQNYAVNLAKLNEPHDMITLRELHKTLLKIMIKMRLFCDIMQMNKLKEVIIDETETEETFIEKEYTDDEKYEFYEKSIKIKSVFDKIEEIIYKVEYKRIIVFSSFVTTIDFLRIVINKKLPDVLTLEYSGRKNKEERHKIVSKFTNESETQPMVLLATLGAGSCGLNLTPCNTVILVDIAINPFDQFQAINRVHRINQKNKVNVYRFCMKDMIENSILKTHEKKINEAKSLGIIMI